jgi:hypothetical protein
MFGNRILRSGVGAILLVTHAACYSHSAVGLNLPAPETRVVIGITDLGANQMANSIGLAAREVEGFVVSATDSVWRLRVMRVDQLGGASSKWNGEEVDFPRSAITNVREKQLNKTNSWLAVGAFVVGVALLSVAAGSILGEEGPPPIVEPELRPRP